MPPVGDWKSGVYCIYNRVNGKRYVGSSLNVERRLRVHKRKLLIGQHENRYLQRSWNRHGADAFEFWIFEMCLPKECVDREQFWIDACRSAERKFGYNLHPLVRSPLGVKRSEETLAKMSAVTKERFNDPAFRAAASERAKQRFSDPAERKRTAETQASLWKDPAYRLRQVMARVGKKLSLQTKQRMSATRTGKKHSVATLVKMAESSKRRRRNPDGSFADG